MRPRKKRLFAGILLGITAAAAVALGIIQFHKPFDAQYSYSEETGPQYRPAMTEVMEERKTLLTITEEGQFICFSEDTTQCDAFVNAQRTLLRFLRRQGLEVEEMTYYGTDYGYSFSESSKKAAYIDLSASQTWEQILVTLQTFWGDYTDYGYLYALSNTLAEELGWHTDAIFSPDKTTVDTFFQEHPTGVSLLYPVFTTDFASAETVKCCKSLALSLFRQLNWKKLLRSPIEAQLLAFSDQLHEYAQSIGISPAPQSLGYAFYSEDIPLRIRMPYAEHLVEDGYEDHYSLFYGGYFSDYERIYQTASRINEEMSAEVQYYMLEATAEPVTVKWTKKSGITSVYLPSTKTLMVSSGLLYLKEYSRYLGQLLNPDLKEGWQTKAFVEFSAGRSWFSQVRMEQLFASGELAQLFRSCTGRDYQPGAADYYESIDIHCHIYRIYDLNSAYSSSRVSLCSYLTTQYGQENTISILLFPELAEAVTGKTWDTLESEWLAHIQAKYAGVQLPDWLNS